MLKHWMSTIAGLQPSYRQYGSAWFMMGLLLRIVLILLLLPTTHAHYFIPFMINSMVHFSLNPWATAIQYGINAQTFPYGIVMYVILLPVSSLCWLVNHSVYSINLALGLTILFFDIKLYELIKTITKHKSDLVDKLYWLSPIVIYINYWHGQLDVIPIYLLLLSTYLLSKRQTMLAGLLLGVAISAKLSMLIALPILGIYIWRNKRLQSQIGHFCTAFIAMMVITQLPWLSSLAYWQMVLVNPQVGKITDLSLMLTNQYHLYLLPIIFMIYLYGLWRIERLNQHLLYVAMGIGFSLILIFTPAAVGWYYWFIPFIVIHEIACPSLMQRYTIYLFNLAFILVCLSIQAWPSLIMLNVTAPFQSLATPQFMSMIYTVSAVLVTLLCLQMIVKGISNNDYFRLSRKPVAIGIAGDSSTGKDTLSLALAGLFESNAVTQISGDDYHKWDRYAPMWQATTHLDPRANNLYKFTKDVERLLNRKPIVNRHYDHHSGRFTQALNINDNDVIIVSGLHVLYIDELQDKLDVKIFLNMDENLRLYYKLRRDISIRNHPLDKVLQSISRRAPDRARYIDTQRDEADLVFCLAPIKPLNYLDYEHALAGPLALSVCIRHGGYYEDLLRMLMATSCMYVEVDANHQQHMLTMIFSGTISANDIALIASKLIPQLSELLAFTPIWQADLSGIMQLITILHIAEKLHSRLE